MDKPIKVGDIVRVEVGDVFGCNTDANFVAKICKITRLGADLDTIGGGWHAVELERCHHATEQQKAEYFKLVLQYGK